jgi:ribosomal protein S14
MAYHRKKKDIKRRDSYLKYELIFIKNKYLIKSCFTSEKEKYFFYYNLLSRTYNYSFFSLQKNRCIYTNRPNWVYRKFKLNRMALKTFINQGSLNGVRTASW